jgi:flagellar biogenesis protein FliO
MMPAIAEPRRYESTSIDPAVVPTGLAAEHSAGPIAPSESKPDPRKVATKRDLPNSRPTAADGQPATDVLSRFGLRAESVYSTLSALIFVLGMFFLGIWALRRGGKKKSGTLPASVVKVLGRVTLAPKHDAELLRVGNKLVLVSLTPDGPKPITEVTDPADVDRLTGLCQQLDTKSSSREFETMFRELANEPTAGDLLGDSAPVISVPPELSAYRGRGGGRRG